MPALVKFGTKSRNLWNQVRNRAALVVVKEFSETPRNTPPPAKTKVAGCYPFSGTTVRVSFGCTLIERERE